MKELIILVLCFVLYVVAVEAYEARVDVARQGYLAPQQQSFNYVPPTLPVTEDSTMNLIIDEE